MTHWRGLNTIPATAINRENSGRGHHERWREDKSRMMAVEVKRGTPGATRPVDHCEHGPLSSPTTSIISTTSIKSLRELHRVRRGLRALDAVANKDKWLLQLEAQTTGLRIGQGMRRRIRAVYEVDEYKDDCRLAKRDAEEIHSIVEQSKANWVQLDTDKKESLREALTKLGVVILECLEALEAVNVDSRRKRDRIRHFFKRDELKQSVKTCREKMKYAKDQLSLSVAFDTNHLVRQIHQHLQPPNTVLVTMSAARYVPTS
ncbi:hypothetical protein PENSPDRAFT_738530 [Peniophora sp. CONT]|nr:hypothetical protein PENSPDRAFT_738530 [Peniophora sp. CONT]